ncbi:unnamed protein product [Effrenium voratum]|nr:unnamed protein product [Effrenium voratum]
MAKAQGNAFFAQQKFEEANRCYAQALAQLKEADKEQAATLRANRSLCFLQLSNGEFALSEAEQCKALRPDWPKAHFRTAAALKACGRLGEARLAACQALRLAPMDAAVKALLQDLRQQLFPALGALGEALDLLEDFTRSPAEVRKAVQVVKDMLLGGATQDVLKAFMDSEGSKTIFRRQNAMGDNWQEECRNGTMSILSEISQAGPTLEQELIRLNLEAEAKETSCGAACSDVHVTSKATDAKMGKSKMPPPPQADDSFASKPRRTRERRARQREPGRDLEWTLPTESKVMVLVLTFGQPSALLHAAAVAKDWAKAASRFWSDGSAEIQEAHYGLELTSAASRRLLRRLVPAPPAVLHHAPTMREWSFLVEIWRDGRRLWKATFTPAHALPGFLEDAEGGEGAPHHVEWPTCYERDVPVGPTHGSGVTGARPSWSCRSKCRSGTRRSPAAALAQCSWCLACRLTLRRIAWVCTVRWPSQEQMVDGWAAAPRRPCSPNFQ